MKLRLQRARVGGASRPDQDRDAVLELHRALLVHGICGLRGQVLFGQDVAQALGRRQQTLAAVRMRHVDQCQRPFSDRLSEQVCNAVFGNNVVHVRPRDSHPIAGFQQGLDPRGAVVGGGCQADDRLAAGRSRRAPDEAGLRRDAAVELAFELVHAGLARHIHRESLRDRDHAGVGGHLLRVADLVDGQELEQRIAVYEVVEPPRSQAVAGDDLVAVARLAAIRHHACLDKVDDAVGDDVAVDAEVAAVLQVPQRLVGDAAKPDLQRGAVVDNGGNVARDPLRDLVGRRMTILRHGCVDAHEGVKPVEVDEALTVGAGHRRVYLSDDVACNTQDRGGEIHRHTETYEAAPIGRGDLKQRHVDRQLSTCQELRHVLQ